MVQRLREQQLKETDTCRVEAYYRRALCAVALISSAACLIHGFWSQYFSGYRVLHGLNTVQYQSLELLNAAITLFLFFTAVTSLWGGLSTSLSLPALRGLSIILTAFWLARFGLELLMPLQIPLLFIQEPGPIIRVFMIVPAGLLCWPIMMENFSSQCGKGS